ncbi:transposase-like protein [Salmonella enterica subsp. enterica]|uniref:Transposase-like protein n=1 Tax=Salmonella enterica I TaxID=59201 RepID=A0A379UKY7_SALET|nr:transposase-like protein [Salmonella enterica subsp. enterica]
MFTINSTNRVASTVAPYACVSDVNLEDKATFLTSLHFQMNIPQYMRMILLCNALS